LPNTATNGPDHILIVGQTGAGKTSFVADYLEEIDQNKTVFVFTASTKPEPFDKFKPYNKVVKNLQSKLLEEGRKHNIKVISSSHLDLATKRLVICQYKTAESHGIREIQISDELAKILIDYKNDLNFSFLVCSPTGHQLVSSSFNRLSNECVDLSYHGSFCKQASQYIFQIQQTFAHR